MPKITVDLKLIGQWKRMAAAVDAKRFQENLEANLNKATAFNGMMVAGEIRRRIKARKYAKNSPLTVLIKGSSTPLIDDGDLWGAVTSKNLNSFTVFVGLLRSSIASDGHSIINIAEFLHQGGTIPVTEHMRNMFILLAEVGEGKRERSTLEGRVAEIAKALGRRIKDIKPLRPETTHLVIKPRPFLRDVLDDPTIHKKCQDNWRKAALAAFKAQAASTATPQSPVAQAADPTRGPSKTSSKAKTPADRSEAARRGWKTRRAKTQAKGKES